MEDLFSRAQMRVDNICSTSFFFHFFQLEATAPPKSRISVSNIHISLSFPAYPAMVETPAVGLIQA